MEQRVRTRAVIDHTPRYNEGATRNYGSNYRTAVHCNGVMKGRSAGQPLHISEKRIIVRVIATWVALRRRRRRVSDADIVNVNGGNQWLERGLILLTGSARSLEFRTAFHRRRGHALSAGRKEKREITVRRFFNIYVKSYSSQCWSEDSLVEEGNWSGLCALKRKKMAQFCSFNFSHPLCLPALYNTRERSVGPSRTNCTAPCFKQTVVLTHQVLPSYIAT